MFRRGKKEIAERHPGDYSNLEGTSYAEAVIDVIATEVAIPRERITLYSSFPELSMDSLDVLETVMGLEESLGIDIPDGETRELRYVGDLAREAKQRYEMANATT